MLTLDEIRRLLQDRRPGMVAEACGVHINTVLAIRDNPRANPTYKVLKAISDYLVRIGHDQG